MLLRPNLHQWSPWAWKKLDPGRSFWKNKPNLHLSGKDQLTPKKNQYKNKGFNLEDYNCDYSDLDDSSDRKGDEVVFG